LPRKLGSCGGLLANVDVTAQSHILKAYLAHTSFLKAKKHEKDTDFLGKEAIFKLCKEVVLVS